MASIRFWRSQTREIELAVFGLACCYCQGTVERVLEDVEGVRSASVDLDQGRARVRARSGVDHASLVEAVRSVGYEARPP